MLPKTRCRTRAHTRTSEGQGDMVINGFRVQIVPGSFGYETSVGGVIVGVFPTMAWAEEAAAYAACELCDRRRRHVQQVA